MNVSKLILYVLLTTNDTIRLKHKLVPVTFVFLLIIGAATIVLSVGAAGALHIVCFSTQKHTQLRPTHTDVFVPPCRSYVTIHVTCALRQAYGSRRYAMVFLLFVFTSNTFSLLSHALLTVLTILLFIIFQILHWDHGLIVDCWDGEVGPAQCRTKHTRTAHPVQSACGPQF